MHKGIGVWSVVCGLEVPQPKKSEGFVRPLDRRKNVKDKYASLAQLVEQRPFKAWVWSSSLQRRTTCHISMLGNNLSML